MQSKVYDADGNLARTLLLADMNPVTQRMPHGGSDRAAIAELRSDRCVKGNCDGSVNGGDIQGFVLALSDPDCTDYYHRYPNCDCMQADMNADGSINGGDIEPFTAALTGAGGELSVPTFKY